MPDPITELQNELRVFARDRGWDRYHTAQNLAALISSEAGELLALFRWGQDSLLDAPDKVRHELADVCLGVLRFADVAGIDLAAACREKISLNARRYPAESTTGPDPNR
jgi:dCTP diphosphatase